MIVMDINMSSLLLLLSLPLGRGHTTMQNARLSKRHYESYAQATFQIPNQLPEPASLRYILISNPSKRLCLPPEPWTDEILQLLDCVCESLPREACMRSRVTSLESFSTHTKYRDTIDALGGLDFTKLSRDRDNAIRPLFYHLIGLAQENRRYIAVPNFSELPLFFGQKAVKQVYYPWLVREKLTSAPVCAFIDETWMDYYDKRYFPARTLQEKRKRKRVKVQCPTPQSIQASSIDPYFVAILIAMAQALRDSPITGQADQSSVYVHLFTSSANRRSLTLYSAEVTARFLKKFDCPYQRSDSRLSITKEDLEIKSPSEIIGAMKEILDAEGQSSINRSTVGAKQPEGKRHDRPKPSVLNDKASRLKRRPLSDITNRLSPSKVMIPSCDAPRSKHPRLDT